MQIRRTVLFWGLSLLCAGGARAQPAYLVEDIGRGSRASGLNVESTATVLFGNRLILGARSMSSAFELWRSDGTPETTVAFESIHGLTPSTAFATTILGDAFFIAGGRDLWVSGGTAPGTRRIRPFEFAGPEIVAAGRYVYFAAREFEGEPALWRSDGDETVPVADVDPLSSSDWPQLLTASGDDLYFFAFDGVARTLWKTDGTPGGAKRLASLDPTHESVEAAGVAAQGRLFFFTRLVDDWNVFRLWTADGTGSGTKPVAVFYGTSDGVCPGPCPPPWGPSDLTPFGDGALFIASDGVRGRQVWRTDGTPFGTRMVRSVGMLWGGLERAGNLVFFGADDGVHGFELWKTDGTESGTVMVTDAAPGDASGVECCGLTSGTLGDRLVYASLGGELWWTDGTAAGTSRVVSAVHGPWAYLRDFVEARDTLYFSVSHGGFEHELWRTDGTEAGTYRLDRAESERGSDPAFLVDAGGRLFFSPLENDRYESLWSSDGTAEGTGEVHEFRAIGPASFVSTTESLPLGGRLFFTADDGEHGYELWVSDGVAETRLVGDLNPGPEGSAASFLGATGERVIFAAYTPGRYGPWVSDGTESGTRPLPAPGSVGEASGAVLGGRVFFTGYDEAHGGELWATDGTDAGTVLVKDVNPGPQYSSIYQMAEAGGHLWFEAYDGIENAVWRTDGTADGTSKVAAMPDGAWSFTGAGDLMYFVSGSSLWRSDGTAGGTLELGPFWPSGLAALGSTLYFIGNDGVHGHELWRTDGTREGTVLVRDVLPGVEGGVYAPLLAVAGRLLFTGDDGEHGYELWMSDGTAEGTGMVQDIARGPGSSFPGHLTVSGSRLYFTADDGENGRELWALALANLAPHSPRGLEPHLRGARPTRTAVSRP